MAAPVATARGTPAGIPLGDGHPTKITLEDLATIGFWEKAVQPPGVEGGDPVETTTFHNTVWRSMRARKLKTLTPVSGTAAYDPAVYDDLVNEINNEQTITVAWSDGSTIAFFGYLQNFEAQEVSEGEQPEASFTIQPINVDPDNSFVEAGPTVVSVGSV